MPEAKSFGLPISIDMPKVVYDFMSLFPQPTRTRVRALALRVQAPERPVEVPMRASDLQKALAGAIGAGGDRVESAGERGPELVHALAPPGPTVVWGAPVGDGEKDGLSARLGQLVCPI
jgi:hypothetical protein